MRVLVDTQSVLWAVDDPLKLGPIARLTILDPLSDLIISAATLWEVSIKVGLGKLRISQPYRTWMDQAVSDLGATVLPITVEYADVQVALPLHHRDPFDRMIIAQALVDGLPIISSDGQLDAYSVNRLW